ncbi:hypothetical protein KSF73_11695 [Burkholderiaceae bacterium DAT-1]|nr:hypothetical protein [Burkholderiaceae bacterium DAT-1]
MQSPGHQSLTDRLFRRKPGEMINLVTQGGQIFATRIARSSLRNRHTPKVTLAKRLEIQSGNLLPWTQDLGMKGADVRTILSPGEYQILQVDLPNVEAEEMNAAVGWQVRDMLRTDLVNTFLDIMPLPSEALGEKGKLGFVIAADSMVLRRYMTQYANLNARVVVIDVPEMAQRNIARMLGEGKPVAVLSVHPRHTLFTVSMNHALVFARQIDIGFDDVRDGDEDRASAFGRLVLEVQRSIDVLDRQWGHVTLSALWLAPFGDRDILQQLLSDVVYIPVKSIDLMSLFDLGGLRFPDDPDVQGSFFLPLGLAMRSMESA